MKKISRLIKKSEYYTKELAKIFKNPTSQEINECKRTNQDNSINGIILDNGDEYCWNGNITHDDMVSALDIFKFRFSYDNNHGWIFNAHEDYTMQEICNLIVKYKNKLSKYGSLNGYIEIQFTPELEIYECHGIKEIEKYLEENNEKIN